MQRRRALQGWLRAAACGARGPRQRPAALPWKARRRRRPCSPAQGPKGTQTCGLRGRPARSSSAGFARLDVPRGRGGSGLTLLDLWPQGLLRSIAHAALAIPRPGLCLCLSSTFRLARRDNRGWRRRRRERCRGHSWYSPGGKGENVGRCWTRSKRSGRPPRGVGCGPRRRRARCRSASPSQGRQGRRRRAAAPGGSAAPRHQVDRRVGGHGLLAQPQPQHAADLAPPHERRRRLEQQLH